MTDDHRADPDRPLTLGDAPAAPTPDAPDTLRLDAGPPPRPPAFSRRWLLMGGAVVVVVLGVLAAVLARPDAPTPGSSGEMAVEMAEPPPLPTPKAGAPLEVLAPDMAAAADRSGEMARELVQPGQEVVPDDPAEAADPGYDQETQAPQASFDCRDARSPAEEMVCSDSGLAAVDRELARAYRRALDAGAPARQLRAEQQDWYEIREDAARRSPAAVSRVYAQRIAELNRLADEAR